ncbi:hypothetical protein [Sedimentisphaera salicampi]|uniref:Uncharacterized protein n=1 Tax=Sedimentisphaera salicampi TaxID=1941349 RepID=A0A1W6LKG1_9BACT|nr:hypothetical protein [Sedimentisphaera salicampi]ARN56259.1 hypothetical protein STSP1_00635 [Sedimentisphaera salicampi]
MKKLPCFVVFFAAAALSQADLIPNDDFSAQRDYWNFSTNAWVENANHPQKPDMLCGRLENGGGMGAQDIRSNLFAVPPVSDFSFNFNSGIWQQTTSELHPVFQVRFYGSKDHGDMIGQVKFDVQKDSGDWWGILTQNSGDFQAPSGTKYMDVVFSAGLHNPWEGGARIGNVKLNAKGKLNPSEGALPLYFDLTDPGVTKRLDYWGMDQTWIDGWNMEEAITQIGHDDFDVVRINFLAVEPLNYDAAGEPLLTQTMKDFVDRAMDQAMRAPGANLGMHLTAKSDLHDWYVGSDGLIIPERTVDGAVAMINYIEDNYGYSIDRWDFVEVINEPDWEYPYSSPQNMAAVMAEFRSRGQLDSVPLLGPSTLSSDSAYNWYSATQGYTDIGGTHVINGSVDSFKGFIEWVHNDGKPFVNPEVHSFAEIMIQADLSGDRPGEGGVFWDNVVPAAGRFIQACKGKRIAYQMDEVTWSGTSVYRDLQNRVWLFAGSSERNAKNSKWEFISTNRDVFINDFGPSVRKTITMGSHAHWHAELTWGDRNPPYYSQYVDNSGETARMAVIDGKLNTTSPNDTGAFTQWKFRPTGAFYYIDNIDAGDAGQRSRLSASEIRRDVGLVRDNQNDNFVKWQLIQIDESFFLENVGMQRAGLKSRLKVESGSVTLTESSDEDSKAQWNFSDTGSGYANLIINGDFEDGWICWQGDGDNGGQASLIEEGGNHFMYIETQTEGSAQLQSPLVKVPSGANLTYSFNSGIWQETSAGHSPLLQIMFYNELGEAEGGWLGQEWLDILRTQGDWADVSTLNEGSINLPDGTEYVQLRFRGGWPNDWKGGFRIDNVSLKPSYNPGDFSKDGSVNLLDLSAIAQEWQTIYDTYDLRVLAENWLNAGN